MGARHTAAVIVVLVVTSGCLVQPPLGEGGGPDSSPYSDGPIRRDKLSPAPTVPSDPGTAIDPSAGIGETPWGSRRVVVGINATDADRENVQALVRQAIAYWERNDHRYADYVADFVLEPAAKDPDVLVTFTDTVECHGTTGWLGCAPKLTATSNVTTTQVVRIRSDMAANVTLRTLKHEFGHLLGVEHGEAPMPLMAASRDASSRPRPDAVNRSFPWRDDRIEIYVAYHQLSAERRARIRPQIRFAVEYFDAGKGGLVPEDVELVLVEDRREADLLIQFPDRRRCGQGPGSCGYTWGTNLDADPAVEYYTRSLIVLADISTETIGWHAGHWLAKAFGAEGPSEMPSPFRKDNRSAWTNSSTPPTDGSPTRHPAIVGTVRRG